MAVGDSIDPLQVTFVLLSAISVFALVFSGKTMWNYFSDQYYATSFETTEKKVTPADEEIRKAQAVATLKRSHWMYYVIPWLELIAKVWLVVSLYRVIYTYGVGGNSFNYTLMFSMLFAVIALDKGIPTFAYLISFSRYYWVSIVYGLITWCLAISTLVILFWYTPDSNWPGGAFIPYAFYNTVLNITAWVGFMYNDGYKVVTPVSQYGSGKVRPGGSIYN